MAAAYLTPEEVNQWLARTKYEVDTTDDELEQTAVELAFSTVGVRYDTSTWADASTTPSLISKCIAMLVAAWYLQRQISDDEINEQSYPVRLEQRAMGILQGIADSTLDLPDAVEDPTASAGMTPLFFPDDAATELALLNPLDEFGAVRAFEMRTTF